MSDVDAEKGTFLELLEKVEEQHWNEVGLTSPDAVENSIFHKLLQDVATEYEEQAASWRKALQGISDNWQEQMAALTSELEDLRKQSVEPCQLGSAMTGADSWEALKQLRDQVSAGASPQALVMTLSRIDHETNLDDTLARHDTEGRGLLHLCLSSGLMNPHHVAANLILLAGRRCDPNHMSGSGEAPLCYAASRKDVPAPVIETLLRIKASPNAVPEHGTSPLKLCVGRSDLDSVKVLLKSQADPNFSDFLGETVLMEAATQDNLAMCKILLEHRADPSLQNNFELMAIDLANEEAVIGVLHPPVSNSCNGMPMAADIREEEDSQARAQAAPADRVADSAQELLRWTLRSEDIRGVRKGERVRSPDYYVRGISCPVRLAYLPKGGVDDEKGYGRIELMSMSAGPLSKHVIAVRLCGPTWDRVICSGTVNLADDIARFKFKGGPSDEIRGGDVSIKLRPGQGEGHLDLLFRSTAA